MQCFPTFFVATQISINREQNFGDPIFFPDFIASVKKNTGQFNISLTTLFHKNPRHYDAINKSVKPLSHHDKNDLNFTQLQVQLTTGTTTVVGDPIKLNGEPFWVVTQGLRSTGVFLKPLMLKFNVRDFTES